MIYWTSEACLYRQGNRAHRAARLLAAHGELSRSYGERYLVPGYVFISCDSSLCRLNSSPLLTGTSLWFKARHGVWWTGKVSERREGDSVVRFLDDAGPRPRRVPSPLFYGALRGLWFAVPGKTRLAIPRRAASALQWCIRGTLSLTSGRGPPPLPPAVPPGKSCCRAARACLWGHPALRRPTLCPSTEACSPAGGNLEFSPHWQVPQKGS